MKSRAGHGTRMIERWVDQAVDRVVRDALADRAYWGDTPALSVPLSREERALRHLGPWLAEGRATMPVAGPYWTEMLQPDPSKGLQTDETFGFDRDMIDLYGDPKQTLDAQLGMAPDLAEAYGAMQAGGLHWGPPPTASKNGEADDDL